MMAAKKGEKKEEVSWMFGLFGKPPPAKEKESLIAPAGGRYKSRMEYDSRARGAKEAAAYMKKNPKSGTINPKDPKTW